MRRQNSILFTGLIMTILIMVLFILVIIYRQSVGNTLLVFFIATILLLVGWNVYFLFGIFFPLQRLKRRFEDLASGDYNVQEERSSNTVFGQMNRGLSAHRKRMAEIMGVLENLAKGNTDVEFRPTSERDQLGQAIVDLRESIMHSGLEMEKRRKLDEQQNWASRGLAKFGELLRDFDRNTGELSALFIRELVKYTEMEAGGFFVRKGSDEEIVYSLMGAWAFDREKNLQKEFRPGEGLVGRCALEKQRIVITDVPEDYIRIRSGLGEDLPSTLILVPVMIDNDVLGIIELVTFSIVKPYKIDFLENLGISIASSVSKAIT